VELFKSGRRRINIIYLLEEKMRFRIIACVLLLAVFGVSCSSGENNSVVKEIQKPAPTVVEPTEIPANPTPIEHIQVRAIHNLETRTGIEEIDRVIDVVFRGNTAELLEIMDFLATGCTTLDGLGGPPKCVEGQEKGSLVEVFPFLGSEGHFLWRTDTTEWQGINISGLFAVYRVSENAYTDPNYPRGEYAIVFLGNNDFTDYTFNVTDGLIVRIDSGFGEIPQIDFEKDASEIILPPPVEATQEAMDVEETQPVVPGQGNPVWLTYEDIPTGLILPEYLAGLVFRNDSIWLVDQKGLSHLAFGQPFNGELSPDGTGFLYSSSMNNGEDIFYFNFASGSVMQLTDTPKVFERGYKWWPARNDVIVFNFIPEDELGPWYGYLGAYSFTTGEYLILEDQQGTGSSFALSPDGQRIVYNQGDQPVIYTWGQGSTPIDMAGFSLNYKSFSSPAWSPDGKKIAFHAAGGTMDEVTGASLSATVIIDLENNIANILHEFLSFGRRAEPEIAWHPDGQWLAVVNPGEVGPADNPMAMWVMRVDGLEEYHFGFSSNMRWSPDGKYLIYAEWLPVGVTGDHLIKLIEYGVWEPIILDDLQGSFISNWITLSSNP
jgi:Tol biopolymer transport system component